MQTLKDFINEKLHVSKYKNNILKPEEIEGPLTGGKDYRGKIVVIFGKPFKTTKDPNYKEADKICHQYKYDTFVGDGDDTLDDDLEKSGNLWVLACDEVDEKIAMLYGYSEYGVLAYKDMEVPFGLK